MTRLTQALNGTQLKILAVLLHRERNRQVPPTIRDIDQAIAAGKDWILMCLRSLRDKGLVAFEDGKARTIRLTCRITVEESPVATCRHKSPAQSRLPP